MFSKNLQVSAAIKVIKVTSIVNKKMFFGINHAILKEMTIQKTNVLLFNFL